jgi:hypothetical protein
MTLMLFSGAWGKMIHEKKLKQESRDTVPLNATYFSEFSEKRSKF